MHHRPLPGFPHRSNFLENTVRASKTLGQDHEILLWAFFGDLWVRMNLGKLREAMRLVSIRLKSYLPFSPTKGSDQVKTSMKLGNQ